MQAYSLHSINERGENERQSENDCEMKTVSQVEGPENRQELVQTV